MSNRIQACHRSLVVAAVVLLALSCQQAAAEPAIEAPVRVPAGSMFAVRTTGLDKDAKFSWHAAGGEPILFDILERQTLAPALLVTPDRQGTLYLVLAYVDADGNPRQLSHGVVVGIAVPDVPTLPPPDTTPVPATKATAVTFVYEKDKHVVPNGVLAALNKLNRDRKILATILEADTTDGTGEVPEQYKIALAAAKTAGLPCLVVTGPSGVIAIVKAPTTEQAVLDAVPAGGAR